MTLRKLNPAPAKQTGRREMGFGPGKRPERLVGIGFRCWLAGYETQDINCWETGWNTYALELGPACAKIAIGELSCWVRAVRAAACRKISYYPFGCAGFSHDECMAISMVAACQHSTCPAMRSCAFALLGSSDIDGVAESTENFAYALAGIGHVLSESSICDASVLSGLKTQCTMSAKH